MLSKKLIFLYFGSVILLGALAFLFFITVDPYGVFNNSTFQKEKWKPEQVTKTRYAKALSILYNQPNAIILGNSRTEYGLDPRHKYFDGLDAYNLAFSSQSIYESFRYLVHANEVRKLEKVLIAIDYDSFNIGTKTGFSENYLCNETIFCFPYVRLLKEAVSFDSVNASFETIFNTEVTRYFHLENGLRDPKHNNYFIDREGGYRNAFRIFEAHVINDYDIGVARINNQALETLENIISYAYKNNIEMVLMFSPAHVRLWEVLDSSKKNGFNVWLEWKKSILDLNLKVAKQFNEKPFKLWDFATYNRYTTESFPTSDSGVMHYHWETSHYKKELGDLALDVISESSQEIGTSLTEKNIDEHLASQKNNRNLWANLNVNASDFERKGFISSNDIIEDYKKYFPEVSSIQYKNIEETISGKHLEVTGNDAYVVYNFKHAINGSLTNYVGMNFSCIEKKGKKPKIQMFWWDDTQEWFSEKFSVKSTINNGSSIINLGQDQNWKSSKSIRSIRIDVPNKYMCGKVKLEGLFYGNNTH
ncbi:hypothetical protein ACRZ5S_13985 [Vibrio scophthalmi]|uniref:hypothetical protein n=1 Tax=Vibrio scophthalmi TaxID=45658 RepID=UPI003EBEB779